MTTQDRRTLPGRSPETATPLWEWWEEITENVGLESDCRVFWALAWPAIQQARRDDTPIVMLGDRWIKLYSDDVELGGCPGGCANARKEYAQAGEDVLGPVIVPMSVFRHAFE